MSLFKVYVDGSLFYHPNLAKLAIPEAQIQEDADNIVNKITTGVKDICGDCDLVEMCIRDSRSGCSVC